MELAFLRENGRGPASCPSKRIPPPNRCAIPAAARINNVAAATPIRHCPRLITWLRHCRFPHDARLPIGGHRYRKRSDLPLHHHWYTAKQGRFYTSAWPKNAGLSSSFRFWFCSAPLIGGMYGPQVAGRFRRHRPTTMSRASMKKFTKVYSTVEQNFADPVSADKAIYKGAIPGMLRTLDPHSNFFDPKDLEGAARRPARPLLWRRHVGAGPQRQDHRGGAVRRFAGLQGRACVRATSSSKVNDKPTEGLDSTKVADLLKGPKGTPVQIKVAREGVRQAGGVQHHSRRDQPQERARGVPAEAGYRLRAALSSSTKPPAANSKTR